MDSFFHFFSLLIIIRKRQPNGRIMSKSMALQQMVFWSCIPRVSFVVARPNVDFGGNAQWVVMYLVCVNLARPNKKDNRYVVLFATTSFWNVHQEFSHFLWFQIYDESNILQDGTLIDLCGATLLWRSSEGLQHSPVIIIDFMPYAISFLIHFSAFDFVFCRQNVIWKS